MSNIRPFDRARRNEEGMTAIFVTMIMIFVISLLVIGFALLSRREQRSSLDTQLSAQAYYAAESGINDAVSAISALQKAGNPVAAKTVCADSGPYKFNAAPAQSTLSAPDKVSYSCVLVDPAPKQLDFKNIGADGVVVPLTTATGNAFSSITITWMPVAGRESDALTGCTTTLDLPPSASWSCKYPLLRVETVPVATLSRASLQANARAVFFKPSSSGTTTRPITDKATLTNVACTVARCSMTISGMGASSTYYMRVNALYGQTPRISVTARDTVGPVGLSGAQALIDATGKAQGVMRRIVVAVDLTDANSSKAPNGAVISGESICKRFSVGPGYFANNVSAAAGSYSAMNTLCKP
jgi:Tfp pilus assembly protein PilX